MARVCHYKFLDKHLPAIFQSLGLNMNQGNAGIVSAHGDKVRQYKDGWEEKGIPFEHGAAIYLLTYVTPYSKESRQTENGWVAPEKWVSDNYFSGHNFKSVLPEIDPTDKEILSLF